MKDVVGFLHRVHYAISLFWCLENGSWFGTLWTLVSHLDQREVEKIATDCYFRQDYRIRRPPGLKSDNMADAAMQDDIRMARLLSGLL